MTVCFNYLPGRPQHPRSWALYVFCGGDLREAELPWLRRQVKARPPLPPVDDDGDMPADCEPGVTALTRVLRVAAQAG